MLRPGIGVTNERLWSGSGSFSSHPHYPYIFSARNGRANCDCAVERRVRKRSSRQQSNTNGEHHECWQFESEHFAGWRQWSGLYSERVELALCTVSGTECLAECHVYADHRWCRHGRSICKCLGALRRAQEMEIQRHCYRSNSVPNRHRDHAQRNGDGITGDLKLR